MSPKTIINHYQRKKWRLLAELIQPVELRTAQAWVAIHESSRPLLLTYESEGLVVSINGGGSLSVEHPQVKEASALARWVVEHGGITMTGGRGSGIMEGVARESAGQTIGVLFPELKKQASDKTKVVIVNNPTPRIDLLAACPPIVVIFRGGLGTLLVLMRAIVHYKNRVYHPDLPPQIIFVNNYWIGLLSTMVNMGALPKEFIGSLVFFETAQQVIAKIPPLIKY